MARISCVDAQELLKELKRNQRDIEDQIKLYAILGDDRSERIELMRTGQEQLADTLRENLPIGMDFEKAKEIMGDSFFGAEETKRQLDWAAGFNEKDMGPIPFSPHELREAAKNEYYLIHRFSKDVFGDPVTPKFIRDNTPNRLQSKQLLEGLFAEIESGDAQEKMYEPGWRIADLKPEIRGDNYFEALRRTAERTGEIKAFTNAILDLKNKLQINMRNKSVSDAELMKISERGLGRLDRYRHSMEEFYYDAIVTGALPDIIDSFGTSSYLTSTKTPNGFVEIQAVLRDSHTKRTETVHTRLADWSPIEHSLSFQRGE